jgi:class 3 adenylate cyclase
VRYDPRGSGLSERDVRDLSIEAMVNDVDAVIQHLDLRDVRMITNAYGFPTPLATAIVARRPDRFTHLVLLAAFESAPAILVEQVTALLQTPGADWRFVSESISRLAQGWDDAETSSIMATLMRQTMDLDGFKRFWAAATTWRAEPFLGAISIPTLVVSYKGHPYFGEDQGRRLVAKISGARLAVVDSPTAEGRGAQMLPIVADFLGGSLAPERRPRVPPEGSPGTAIILFADIADSTALTERLGDDAFRAKARDLDAALRTVIRDHSGTPIEGKLLGDGVLAVFISARQAIEAALACAKAGAEASLPLHLGLHAGDVIREDNNVYGGAVNIASRISGLSAPGEVLVSETVRSLARTSAGLRFEDRGEQTLKGVGDAVRVWVVRKGGE